LVTSYYAAKKVVSTSQTLYPTSPRSGWGRGLATWAAG